MTREEFKINKAKEMYPAGAQNSLQFRTGFCTGFDYADQHPRKGLVDIDKIASFIKYHAQEFVYISTHSGEAKINEFKLVEAMYKAMEE